MAPDCSTIEKQAAAGQLAGRGAIGEHELCHSATPDPYSDMNPHDLDESAALAMLVSTTAAVTV